MHTNVTVEKLFKAWNNHNVTKVLSFYSDDFIREDGLLQKKYEKQKLNLVIKNYFKAFPDLELALDKLIENNNQTVVCWNASGHHKGKIMNIPATNKFISFSGVSVLNIEHGKIKKAWYLWDQASMLRQMGLLPEID